MPDETLLELVDRLTQQRVLVLGDLMLDRYIWGHTERISPEAPIPVLRAGRREERLGGVANVAAVLCALEAKVTLAGVLGEDPAGTHCRALLSERGIRAGLVLIDSCRQTTLKERYMGRADQKHPQQVLRVDYESQEPISGALVQQLLAGLKSQLAEHDIVLVSDYGKGVCCAELVQGLIHECKAQKKRILIDPGQKTPDLGRFRGASCITPNRREVSLALGLTINDPVAACAAAEKLRKQLELETCLITIDRDGMVLADSAGQHHFPTRERHVYDITGAGDVALAMLGLCVASGLEYPQAIELANVAAGLSVERIGVTVITREEILADLLRNRSARDKLIPSYSQLAQEMNLLRRAGQSLVFTNGCFDILHSGHIHLLREARRQGDLLVVGLNSDASVRSLAKGDGRPINSQELRARVLGALEYVDYICIFDEPTPWEIIQAVRPAVMVKGSDWKPENIVGKDFVESYGGRLHLVNLQPGLSTTATIDRIKKT